MLFSAPKSDPDVIYIGLNDRDKSWHDLYKLKISTGERTLIRKNTDRIAAWIFDLQGNLRLAQRVQDTGDQEILRVDADGFTPIYTCNVFETCDVIQFHKDGRRAYIQTNKGAAYSTFSLLPGHSCYFSELFVWAGAISLSGFLCCFLRLYV